LSFVDLKICIIDDKLAEIMAQGTAVGPAYPINKNITFALQRTLSTNNVDNGFLPINDETIKVREIFRETAQASQGSPIGAYTIKNCCVLGQPGVIIDPDHHTCWLGYSLGWNLEMLKTTVQRNNMGEVINGKILRVRRSVLESCKKHSVDSAHLLSLPGYAVFGHWIVDIAPRLQFLRDNPPQECTTLCAPPAASWANELARMYDIDLADLLLLKQGEGIHVEELSLSSCIKSNRIIDGHSARAAWKTMQGAYINNEQLDVPASRKIYVSRSKLDSPRKFINGGEIDIFFSSLGWQVVHPEELSLHDQAAIFSHASIIAGDDGSALHNSIYAKPGTKILCLDFQRGNLLHASIANALKHKLAYVNGDKFEDRKGTVQWEMPITRLKQAVSMLENS